MVEDFDKYMQVARILNNSWGTGSQLRPNTTQSIKFSLTNDKLLKGSFMMIVNLPNNPKTLQDMKMRYKDQGLQMLKGALEKLKEDFQNQNDGKSISFKLIDQSVNESVELLTNAQYRPTIQGYFRLHCLISID